MQNILKRTSSALMVAVMTSVLLAVPITSAVTGSLIDPEDNPTTISDVTGAEGSFRALALTVLNFFLSFLGFIAVIFVIYGGIQYITAGGQQDKVDNAKKILLYSGAGLVIILLSFALVNTILAAGDTGSSF